MSVLEGLNPAQRDAALIVEGPLLILAGAGSGKTRVLTYRIAHLIREVGVPPWNILAVTFTNKAAGEMGERIERLVGGAMRHMWIGTFHAICARLLRFEAGPFGIEPNFTIYDEDDRRALVRRLLKSLNIAEEEVAPRAAIGLISRAKNAMVDPQQFARDADESPFSEQIARIYVEYEAELRRHNALDFDDLLVFAVREFEQHPEVLEKYQERFRHILVDEYQDTNRPQYLLCRQLASGYRNICCVGDDDQSIYQFRGADIRNILDFERDYPEARIARLEQNYRSTGRILAAANSVIQHNRHRKGKTLWTAGEEGDPIELVTCDTDRIEARRVADTLADLISRGDCTLNEAAVLYRTNAQSRALEEELRRARMAYQIVGGLRFYDRKEIKDILAYLRLLANPADNISFERVVNVPRRGIGGTTMEALQAHVRRQGLSLTDALSQLDQVPGLGARARRNLGDFQALMQKLHQSKEELELPELTRAVATDTGYLDMLRDEDTPEADVREENINGLLAEVTEFADNADEPTLESFLEQASLQSSVDEMDDGGQALTLMTLHSAKGLEYPVVFICGIEEELFPTSRAIEEAKEDPRAIEEERRLFYVGITRAQRRLYLTWARRRYTYGEQRETEPSRFLDEIPSDLLESKTARGASGSAPGRGVGGGRARTPKREAPQGVHYEWEEPAAVAHVDEGFADMVDEDDFLAVGNWVLHPTWGRGQIVDREGSGAAMKLSIRFGQNRVKRVAVAYAQLEPG